MQNLIFPLFVGLGMCLAALAHLLLGPALLLQLSVLLVVAGMAVIALQAGGAD